MKVRYLLLPLALFQAASLFGANASANAAAAPEADTKASTSTSATDVKQSAANSAVASTTGNESNNEKLELASFVQWVDAHRCPPTCKAKKLSWAFGLMYPGCEKNPAQFIKKHEKWGYEGYRCFDGVHCDDQCLIDFHQLGRLGSPEACSHMKKLALKCFERDHAQKDTAGRSSVSLEGLASYKFIFNNKPIVTESLVPHLPKELVGLILGYNPGDRTIQVKFLDSMPHPITQQTGSRYVCTYNLDTDSMSVDSGQYWIVINDRCFQSPEPCPPVFKRKKTDLPQ